MDRNVWVLLTYDKTRDGSLSSGEDMVVIRSSVQVALGAELLHRSLDLGHIDTLEHPSNKSDVHTIVVVLSFRRDDTHDLARERVKALVLVEGALVVRARVSVDVASLLLASVKTLVGTSVGLRRLDAASELEMRVDGFKTVEEDLVVVDDDSHVACGDGATVLERLYGAEHSDVDVLADIRCFLVVITRALEPLSHFDLTSAILDAVGDVRGILRDVSDHCDEGQLTKLSTIKREVGIRMRVLGVEDLSNGDGPQRIVARPLCSSDHDRRRSAWVRGVQARRV